MLPIIGTVLDQVKFKSREFVPLPLCAAQKLDGSCVCVPNVWISACKRYIAHPQDASPPRYFKDLHAAIVHSKKDSLSLPHNFVATA